MKKKEFYDLSGKVAVITGGASGIGQSTALRLASAGADLAIVDLDETACAKTIEQIQKEGRRAITCNFNVSNENQVQQMTEQVLAELGSYHILVCCAAIGDDNLPAWESSVEIWRKVLDVNLTGVWLCNRAALGPMRKQNYGRIVNIASIAGKEGNPKQGAYSASKAGVIGMTKSLAKEVVDTGIRINSVAPTVIQTPMIKQATEETLEYMTSRIPMGRIGKPEEVAALIHYLVSDECSFSTGFCFDISGGRATY